MLGRLFNSVAPYTTPAIAEAVFAAAVLWPINPVVRALGL